MIKKIKQFIQMNKKPDIKGLWLVTLQPDKYLFQRWCELDMINSGEDATRESIFEFIGIDNELKRRGYGNEKDEIIPSKLNTFCNIVLTQPKSC